MVVLMMTDHFRKLMLGVEEHRKPQWPVQLADGGTGGSNYEHPRRIIKYPTLSYIMLIGLLIC